MVLNRSTQSMQKSLLMRSKSGQWDMELHTLPIGSNPLPGSLARSMNHSSIKALKATSLTTSLSRVFFRQKSVVRHFHLAGCATPANHAATPFGMHQRHHFFGKVDHHSSSVFHQSMFH